MYKMNITKRINSIKERIEEALKEIDATPATKNIIGTYGGIPICMEPHNGHNLYGLKNGVFVEIPGLNKGPNEEKIRVYEIK